MKQNFRVLVTAVMVALSHNALAAEKVTICYEEWPPAQVNTGGKVNGKNGFIVDMAIDAFKKNGWDVTVNNLPYARAIASIEDGSCDLHPAVVAGAAKNVEYSKEPFYKVDYMFFVKKELKDWKYEGVSSLKGLKIGSVVGYDYSEMDADYQKYVDAESKKENGPVKMVSGNDAVPRIMELLSLGRLDVFGEANIIASSILKEKKLENSVMIAGKFPKPLNLFVGVSTKNPEKTKKIMGIIEKQIETLAKPGETDKFLAPYGLAKSK